MKKGELLHALAEVHEAWNRLLARIPQDRMTDADALDSWSIKDAIAHVAWVEAQTVGMLRARALVGASELWRMPEDERNALVVAERKDRPLNDVLDEASQTQRELIEVLEAIRPEDIDGADWFAALPGKWPPSRVVEVNVIDHYQHHIEDLARWYRRSV